MAFCADVVTVALRKARAVRSVISGGLLWGMSKFGEGS